MADDPLMLTLIREVVLTGAYRVAARQGGLGCGGFEKLAWKHHAIAAELADEVCRRGPAPEAVG